MAEAAVNPYEIRLPVKVDLEPYEKPQKGGLEEMARVMCEDLPSLNIHFQKANMDFIHVNSVVFVDKNEKIFIHFNLCNESELILFKKADDDGTLNTCFSKFAAAQKLNLFVGAPTSRLFLEVKLKNAIYKKAEKALKCQINKEATTAKSPEPIKEPKHGENKEKNPKIFIKDYENTDEDAGVGNNLPFPDTGSPIDEPSTNTGNRAVGEGQTTVTDPDANTQHKHQEQRSQQGELSSNVEKQGIQKTFYVYFPSKKNLTVLTVRHCSSWMKTSLHEVTGHSGLWCITFSDCSEAQYWYEVDVIRQTYIVGTSVKLWSSEKTWTSSLFTTTTASVQRDVEETDLVRDALEAHLVHIISSVTHENLKESVMQVELLLQRHSLMSMPKTQLDMLFKNVMDRTSHDTDFSLLLLAVVIGLIYFCKGPSEEFIPVDKAKQILQALQNSKPDSLTNSCSRYIPRVCEVLCKVAHGRNDCILKVMLSVFPFLDETHFLEYLRSNRFPVYIADVQPADDLVDDVRVIYSTVGKQFHQQQSEHCRTLLEFLTRRLPLGISTRAWVLWKTTCNDDGELQKCVSESITTVLKADIITARKKKDCKAILTAWKLTASSDLSVITKPLIEQAFLSIIKQKNVTLLKDDLSVIKTVVTDGKYALFNANNILRGLLHTFADSDNKDLHSLFLEMIQSHNACNNLVDSELVCLWYKNAVRNFCTRYSSTVLIDPALSYLSDILSIEACTSYNKDLYEIAFRQFEKDSITHFLGQTKVIEKEVDKRPIIGDIYTVLALKKLNQKFGTKPYEMIYSLCTSGELRVNSRVMEVIVCTILDQYEFDGKTDTTLDTFSSMMASRQFWELVLKVHGKQCDNVKRSSNFKKAYSCLMTTLELFRRYDVPCAYVQKLTEKSMIYNAKQLLDIVSDTSFVEISRLFQAVSSGFQEEKEKLSNVLSVLDQVKNRLQPQSELPSGYRDIIRQLEIMQSKLQKGLLTTRDMKSVTQFWGDLADFPNLCEHLKSLVCSDVFWNVCLDAILKEFNRRICDVKAEDADDCIVEDIHRLFDVTVVRDIQSELDTHTLLKVVIETGGSLYRDAWEAIQNDETTLVSDVSEMIGSADIKQEVKFAEKFLRSHVKQYVVTALLRLSTLHEIEYQVQSMKSALQSFGIDLKDDEEINEAFTSFENLLSRDVCSSTFADASHNMEIVFRSARGLSQDAIDILSSLGKSTTLIEFLCKIVDEDIRNLIDAVEDLSEQHVRESTVSGLIEVKRFLQPLLKAEEKLNAKFLFEKVSTQTNMLTKPSLLAAKIDDCMDNLHNLKSLYNNVANRGEQTKEIIEHILKKGKFHFALDSGNVCDFKAMYTQEKKKVIHTKTTLIDLRSRALLLMNTDTKETERRFKGEDLARFVGFVDLCMEIEELSTQLFMSGHIEYKAFYKTEDPANLHDLGDYLKNELDAWNDVLSSARGNHYLLNYIQGTQLHILHHYLETGNEKKKVSTMLKFIHPDLEVGHLQDFYNTQKEHSRDWSKKTLLNCIGEMLFDACEKLQFFNRSMYIQSAKTGRLDEVVQKGKLFVATLEENSLLVVKILLALYGNTTQKLPEANQVLFCTNDTSWDEVILLIQRCLGACEYHNQSVLYCITNVELLSNELQFRLVDCLRNLQRSKKFMLAVICRGSSKHPFLGELSDYARIVRPITDANMMKIFQQECPHVFTYTSDVAGLGKTNTIQVNAHKSGKAVVNQHISGPVHKEQLVERLRNVNIDEYHILHIDIGNVDSPLELDMFLFELILLKYVQAGTLSVNLATTYVSIEIANTINNMLRNSLQTAMAFQREHLKWENYKNFIVSKEINSPVQVVCHFLQCLQNGNLDQLDILFNGIGAVESLPTKLCRQLLQKYFTLGSEMSFSIVNTFLNVFADQLKKMSCSTFFRTTRIYDMMGHKTMPTVRSSLVQALMAVSHEFSSCSVNACRSAQKSTMKTTEDDISSIASKRTPAESSVERIDSMIRWEESNHLIYVFHNQNIQTISPMYRDIGKVPSNIRILFESQMKRAMDDFKKMDQQQLQIMLQKVARTNPVSLSPNRLDELSKYYALTPDNLLKMVLIMLRIKANIPVIIMGETGCGKTSLVRYLADICEVPFVVLSIHAGVEECTILENLKEVNEKALKDTKSEYWLFLDEINTSEHLGLMSDMICHKRCLGMALAPNLAIMAACNPYKLRTSSAISSAGLQGKVKSDDLSRLVYRVLPLPEMMVDYVWDFGSLSENDEIAYIKRMTKDVFPGKPKPHDLLTDLLCASQKFVRENEKMSSSVSLRDIQRCRILTEWFLDILPKKRLICPGKLPYPSDVTNRAIILALAHCYHSRFSNTEVRREYRVTVSKIFVLHSLFEYNEHEIHDVIKEEQKDIIHRMELPEGTAQNTALQENVFVILVCILNKMPIFLVGKPGCSKSLSMQVIRSNLRGKDSKDEFFKTLPQLYCVSYQGSESSTSDGIIRVFEKAENYQKSNRDDEVLSVVILDEIGLAEISRFNPLKVLHNLLEPDGNPTPNVAVVGISNWALDASKMNRAVHLSRPEMDIEELYETAISISDSFVRSTTRDTFSPLAKKKNKFSTMQILDDLHQIAKSYVNYTQKLRFKNFHGLRDYYSLVKFISRALVNDPEFAELVERKSIIQQGLQRNFGGLPSELATLLELFQITQHTVKDDHIPVMKLIKDNITDKMARHLMLITSGDGVMGILENELNNIGRVDKLVIFGSQFEEDLTDDYNYRILSRIILCMEEGLVLVLKDLDNIYGSLYDMLNQNYTIIGKKKNCRIALGHYSNPVCHVNDTFRCVVLVDENQLDHSDPPFLNRFEKQYLRFSDTITSAELDIIEKLNNWVNDITVITEKEFKPFDTFPIYSEDMVASLVMKMSRELESDSSDTDIVRKCTDELLWIVKPESIIRLTKVASLDIKSESDMLKQKYFDLPLHDGISGLVAHQMKQTTYLGGELQKGLMTIVFTNSNIHSKILNSATTMSTQIEKLGSFKSEKQLSTRLKHFWMESETEVLFLQCSAIDDDKHIRLAKSIIEHLRTDSIKATQNITKHVYIIVHLDRNKGISKTVSQLNFLTDWKLVMLDCIETPEMTVPELCRYNLLELLERKRPLNHYFQEQLTWAFTRIKYTAQGRDVRSICHLLENIENCPEFLNILDKTIFNYISKTFYDDDDDWQVKVSCDIHALDTSSSFVDALEQHMLQAINVPLSKVIFQLETASAIDCYLLKDDSTMERRETWTKMLTQKDIFSIHDIPDENGPECYTCPCENLSLYMPFSRYIFNKIESTKDEFMEYVTAIKAKCDLGVDEELPNELLTDLLLKVDGVILQEVPDMSNFVYPGWTDDYIHDFCNIVSFSASINLKESFRIDIMRWALQQKTKVTLTDPTDLFVALHTTFWINASLFCADMQLLETCNEVLYKDDDLLKILNKTCEVGDELESLSGDNRDRESEIEMKDIEKEIKLQNDASSVVSTVSSSSDDMGLNVNLKADGTIESKNDNEKQPTISSEETDSEYSDSTVEVVLDTKQVQSENENVTTRLSTDVNPLTSVGRNSPTDGILTYTDLDKTPEPPDPQVRLVEMICKKMLPTKGTLDMFPSVATWQMRVNCILTLAAEVSLEPSNLHALKFCSDIVGSIVIPHKLHTQLEELGNILKVGHSLDEEIVFERVMHMIRSCPQEAKEDCQRTLSQYIVRCMFSDPDTRSYMFLFETIVQSELPDNNLCLMKAPFYDALQNELVDDDSIFTDILLKEANISNVRIEVNDCIAVDTSDADTGSDTENSEVVGDIDESDDGEEYPAFLKDTDECLHRLYHMKRADSEFPLLLVDLLEDIYSEEIEECYKIKTNSSIRKTNERLLASHKILRENNFGLKFAAAVAYFKRCVTLLTHFLLKDDTDKSKFALLLQTLNVVLDQDSLELDHGLHMFLLKAFGKDTNASHFKQHFQKVQRNIPHLEAFLTWTEIQMKVCFDGSPLCIHDPMELSKFQVLTECTELQKPLFDDMIEAAVNDVHKSLAIHSAVTTHYYIARSRGDIGDTMKSLAGEIWNTAKEKMEPKNVAFLERLLGLADFSVRKLNLSEESSSEETTIASFLVVMYALLLTKGNDKSVFVKVLKNAIEVKKFFMPGNPDGCEMTKSECSNNDIRYANCECGHRLAVLKAISSGKFCQCVICGMNCTMSKATSRKVVTVKNACKRGYDIVDNNDDGFTVRNLSTVAYNILKVITNGVLLGSIAMNFCSTKDMEEITAISEIDAINLHLLKEIERHWHRLETILNMGHYNVGLFLHAVLFNAKDLLCENETSVSDPNERLLWETDFTTNINKLTVKRYDAMHELVCQHENSHKGNVAKVIEEIHEMDDISFLGTEDRNICLPSLFRLQGEQTFTSFNMELSMRKADEFQFLRLVLKMRHKLQLLKNLIPILRWHLATVPHASYIMKKYECQDMTVTDFLYHNEDQRARDMIKKRFDDFQKSWNGLEEQLAKDPSDTSLSLEQITRSSKVTECLILNDDSPVYLVLKELVDIQNEFLDETMAFASSCKATSFLMRNDGIAVVQSIPITEAKSQTIINFNWSNDVLDDSQCYLNYNKGRHVQYDFESIERRLSATILVNKSNLLLKKSLPSITFSDELYKNYVSMVKELNEVVPQKSLPSDIVLEIAKNRKSNPKLITNLLTNLGIILSVMKKTKGDPSMPLVDYANQWKNILTCQFPKDTLPSPESSVQLCHLVALHELLEEHNADIVIDSLEKRFKEPLNSDLEQHLGEIVNKDMKMAKRLLRAVKLFSHRCLSLRDAVPELPLYRYLSEESFWSDGGIMQDQEARGFDIHMLLPESLMVHHVHAMVSLIEVKIKEADEKEMTLDTVHTSWCKRGTQQKAKSTEKRKAMSKRRK